MEELKVLANSYAEENVINVLKESFAKVYADGYRDGYKAREEEIPVVFHDNHVEFIDLGLPSGTLWSSDYERIDGKLTYHIYEDVEALSIPSVEQCQELLDFCSWVSDISYGINPTIKKITCVGPNGNKINFGLTGYIKIEDVFRQPTDMAFWTKYEGQNFSNKKAVIISNRDEHNSRCRILKREIRDTFMGYKLPVRLVKTK